MKVEEGIQDKSVDKVKYSVQDSLEESLKEDSSREIKFQKFNSLTLNSKKSVLELLDKEEFTPNDYIFEILERTSYAGR